MNIVILNGSPRANGNTATFVKAFQEAAGKEICNDPVFRLRRRV